VVVFVLFIILQIADGLFTLHGVNAVGIDGYESNPLLVDYMRRFGAAETILVAKMVAGLLGYLLYRQKRFNVLWLLSGFYLCILYTHIMFLIHYNG